jgi:threonine aldolase
VIAPGVRGFASDNSAGVHPEVLQALAAASSGHAFGYGHDDYTQDVQRRVADLFSPAAEAFFVFNGTAANVLSLRAACRRWQAVICAETSHLNVDECGAPEAIAGVKLLTVPTEHGKLLPTLVESRISRIGDEHAVQPRVVSISQCTELGTVYTPQETRALAEHAHGNGMLLHVDGARLANAAAALDLPLQELVGDCGVDILSFGGTKNGLLAAEAVVFLTPGLADGFEYLRKQSLQLASKMRFLAAQFDALLADRLWLRNAHRANAMAGRLADALGGVGGVSVTHPVQTNVVFASLPAAAIAALQERVAFYVWDRRRAEVRWMCSWDTTEADVDEFARAIAETVGYGSPMAEPRLIIQVPQGGAVDRQLRSEPLSSISTGDVVVDRGPADARGVLEPPAAGKIVLSLSGPQGLVREADAVRRVIGQAGTGVEPLVVEIQAAEALSEPQLAVILDAADHASRAVILRIIRDA